VLELFLVKDVRVVVVPCRNDRMGPQFRHRSKAFGEVTMFHKPSRRLWAEPDAATKDERRNERRAELEAPSDGSSVFDNDIGAES